MATAAGYICTLILESGVRKVECLSGPASGNAPLELSNEQQLRVLNGDLVLFSLRLPDRRFSSFWSAFKSLEPGLQRNVTGSITLHDPNFGANRLIPAATDEGVEKWLAGRIVTSEGLALRVFQNDLLGFAEVLREQGKILAVVHY